MMDEKEIIEQQLFKDTSEYNDIIDYDYHGSKNHLPMSQGDRAGQFAPFAALTGFGSLISKIGKTYGRKDYLTADQEKAIASQLGRVAGKPSTVTINYFNDQSGYYEEFNDQVTTIKPFRGRVFFKHHPSIPIANVKGVTTHH